MSNTDPIDAHRALQKACRELAHFADHGDETNYREAIPRLTKALKVVKRLPAADRKTR